MDTVHIVVIVAVATVAFLAGALIAPALRRRRPRVIEDTGLTIAQVLDHIVRSTPSGVAVVDEHRDVVLFNPRATELGLVDESGRLDDRAWVAAQVVLRNGDAAECDLSNRELGARENISVRGTARMLSQYNSNLVLIFADDDSEQVRMESARRDFVANVSHELKTPMGAMSLLAEALLESSDDPDAVRHFGGKVLMESNRLGNMVKELISLSRLQGAEKLPELSIVDIDELVNEAVVRSRLSAETADITVATDRPSGLEVAGDRTLLLTALTNLVENAITYSPAGSSVSVSRSLRDGKVAVSVTDRGIGIAKENQERVFERFFRVDPARSRSTGGTGLGLAIVKHVVANHNGEIELWSKPGIGSTFTIRIPAFEELDTKVPLRDLPLWPDYVAQARAEQTNFDRPAMVRFEQVVEATL
ncbi:sensor histidine kinase [Aldersonia kunmingensis]|uniref:sensor histidine kinase n=1 Tax=Aldersonia kunmingensis TaxID=408066 RepID=UPI0009FF1F74|nr:ATP-binding protein [Aldersonia kunmingensis]